MDYKTSSISSQPVTAKVQVALWVVATPIGNLGDISRRAAKVLAEVDCIVAEDTRHSRTLLTSLAINKPMLSLHEHNEQQRIPQLLQKAAAGEVLALLSDAGTPLISDPGFKLVQAFHQAGWRVSPLPGPCAAIAALSVAGLPSSRFHFEGFLPARAKARQQRLQALSNCPDTLIFYESPKRLQASLQAMCDVFGEQRLACQCRELTKQFETVNLRPLGELLSLVSEDADQQRGEQVLLVAGAPEVAEGKVVDAAVRELYLELCTQLPPARAAAMLARHLDVSRNALYQLQLDQKKS